MTEKACYQALHPSDRTDCFELAGNITCSSSDCLVYRAINSGRIPGSLRGNALRSFIVCNLLHYVCRMSSLSPDNAEFFERTKGRHF